MECGVLAALVLGKSVLYYGLFRWFSDRLGTPSPWREVRAALGRALGGVLAAAAVVVICSAPACLPLFWLGRAVVWYASAQFVCSGPSRGATAVVVCAGLALNLLIDLGVLAAFGAAPTLGVWPSL